LTISCTGRHTKVSIAVENTFSEALIWPEQCRKERRYLENSINTL
jgi:hypothetical protein